MRVLACCAVLSQPVIGGAIHEGTSQLQAKKGHKLVEQLSERGSKSASMIAGTQKMSQTLSDAIKSTIHSADPEVMARVEDLIEVMNEQMVAMRAAIIDENAEDQGEISAANDAVAQCNTDRHNAYTEGSPEGVDYLNSEVASDRATHADCRDAEDIDWIERESNRTFANEKSDAAVGDVPSCLGAGLTNMNDVSNCMKLGRGWHTDHKTVLNSAIQEYDASNAIFTATQIQCDGDQQDFESEFCTYATRLVSVCGALDTCYDNAIAARSSKFSSVGLKETSQKELWHSVCKIECLIGLFEDAANDNLDEDSVDQCDSSACDADAANLTISYPDADPKDACPTETAAWNESEYDGMTVAYIDPSATCVRKYSCGCADGTREASFPSVNNTLEQREFMAGCAGTFEGTVSGTNASALCAEGWHVCTGSEVQGQSLTVADSGTFSASSCYIYNGAVEDGDCVATCEGSSVATGLGQCSYQAGDGCLSGGSHTGIDSSDCKIGGNHGAVCCRDDISIR